MVDKDRAENPGELIDPGFPGSPGRKTPHGLHPWPDLPTLPRPNLLPGTPIPTPVLLLTSLQHSRPRGHLCLRLYPRWQLSPVQLVAVSVHSRLPRIVLLALRA